MDNAFLDAVVRAGLDPELVTPHVIRHTSITALVQSGVDLTTIQKISGHKTLAMVLRYTLMHGQHIDRPIEAIGRNIAGTPGEQSRQHNYTGIIQRLSRGSRRQRLQLGEKRPCFKELRPLEAGSGIEPLYEDLQSSA